MTEDCVICGQCWWNGCSNPADWTEDVHLKRHGLTVFDGKVDLCTGHHEQAVREMRMNISWAAIEQALAAKL